MLHFYYYTHCLSDLIQSPDLKYSYADVSQIHIPSSDFSKHKMCIFFGIVVIFNRQFKSNMSKMHTTPGILP